MPMSQVEILASRKLLFLALTIQSVGFAMEKS
jgi:hypothetical protein